MMYSGTLRGAPGDEHPHLFGGGVFDGGDGIDDLHANLGSGQCVSLEYRADGSPCPSPWADEIEHRRKGPSHDATGPSHAATATTSMADSYGIG